MYVCICVVVVVIDTRLPLLFKTAATCYSIRFVRRTSSEKNCHTSLAWCDYLGERKHTIKHTHTRTEPADMLS